MSNREYLIDVLIYSIGRVGINVQSCTIYRETTYCNGDGIRLVKYTLLNKDHENTKKYILSGQKYSVYMLGNVFCIITLTKLIIKSSYLRVLYYIFVQFDTKIAAIKEENIVVYCIIITIIIITLLCTDHRI